MDNNKVLLTNEYLAKYYIDFEKEYEKVLFERQEKGLIHNSVEWGNWVYECLKNNDVDEMIHTISSIYDNYSPGKLSKDKLRSSKNLINSLLTVLVHYSVRDRLVDNELALTASDVCINMCEQTKDKESLLTCAYAGLIKISDLITEYHEKEYHPLIKKVKEYIHLYLHTRIKINKIAEILGVSIEHLSRTFKKGEGISIQQFIINEKIDRAIHLLKTTDMSILEISTSLAFNSQSHFTETFKKVTGKTPLSYRNEFSDIYISKMK